MINKIIAFSIHNKFIVGLLVLALIGTGLYSMYTVNLGSVPDITNNQVQVITVSQNLATEDMEQFVTYPVELAMGNLPGVEEIRSISRFGLSVVTIVFADDMGTYLPRQLVQEQLNELQETIPEDIWHSLPGTDLYRSGSDLRVYPATATGLRYGLFADGAAYYPGLDRQATAHPAGRGGRSQLLRRLYQAV